jgi:hypothetical protein
VKLCVFFFRLETGLRSLDTYDLMFSKRLFVLIGTIICWLTLEHSASNRTSRSAVPGLPQGVVPGLLRGIPNRDADKGFRLSNAQ